MKSLARLVGQEFWFALYGERANLISPANVVPRRVGTVLFQALGKTRELVAAKCGDQSKKRDVAKLQEKIRALKAKAAPSKDKGKKNTLLKK